jgi:hypothetical protein
MRIKFLQCFIVWFLAFLAIACCGPNRWAERVDSELRCNMSAAEIETALNKKILNLEGKKFGWATHWIKDGNSSVYFGLDNNHLKWLRVQWGVDLERIAMYQKVDLCGTNSDPDSTQLLN